MNTEEAFAICRMAKGAFPATTMDEFTPDAWALALEDDRFEDCKEALKQLMREQTFIHVSDIVQRVGKIRRERVLAYGVIEPPADLNPDDPVAYKAWFIGIRQQIADGEVTNPDPQMPALRGPWTEDSERAIASARMRELRAEVAKRKPDDTEPPELVEAREAFAAMPTEPAAARAQLRQATTTEETTDA